MTQNTSKADTSVHALISDDVSLKEDVREKWYYPFLAPLSAHYRQKTRLARTPLSDRIVLDHLASSEYPKVVFSKNSKAACTSIAHAIYKLATGAQYNGVIHQEAAVLSQGRKHWETNIARLASPSYQTFTFVRHPVDRVESAFRDFVTEGRNPNHAYHKEQFRKFGCREDRSESENFSAFLEYVEASLEVSRLRTDRHWRLQVDNIGWGRFQYDHIGRVERLAEDLMAVLIMAGVDKDAAERVVTIRKNASQMAERIANPDQISKIQALYAEDFDAFGYD
ncbi:hypothetical protein B6V72_03135 [Thioclava sp. F34-6]|uniref:sulfotransferase family protein n=1 Tax=Thioclava sp. F34-6 TaxID=1973003 RepID=UPI000B545AED|nr:sulfotransferase family protein [Thioclava sp. F34-6]OWY15585.1 hypothetical protein B6V72_03135 [Thioclava sp. F34-6]